MLTRQGCVGRRERLLKRLASSSLGVEALVITEPAHLTYLSGYVASPFEFRSVGAPAVLLLDASGRCALVVDNLTLPYAEASFVDEVVTTTWYEGRRSAEPRRQQVLGAALQSLGSSNLQRVGVELSSVPELVAGELRRRGAELVDVEPALLDLRRRKDPDEVATFLRSVRAGEAGHRTALREVRPGMTELELYQLVWQAASESLGEAALVYGDFVSGLRTAKIGGFASDRVISEGELVLLDFSVIVSGYRADFANTFVCGARPAPAIVEAFDACLAALAVGEARARALAACREVDAAMRDSLGARREHFLTHGGHGLGLHHPEAPFIVPESTDTLEVGNIITLEPGQYIASEYGMRFERNYLVTETGLELLSNHALTLSQ